MLTSTFEAKLTLEKEGGLYQNKGVYNSNVKLTLIAFRLRK